MSFKATSKDVQRKRSPFDEDTRRRSKSQWTCRECGDVRKDTNKEDPTSSTSRTNMVALGDTLCQRLNRSVRIAKTPDYPPFLSDIMVRKRRWRRGTFGTSTETVKYLCPAPEEHGHWVLPKDEAPRITKLIMKATRLPLAEEKWIALERESVDALAVRRRMRGKSTIRKLQEEDGEEKDGEEEKKRRVCMLRLIEKEMCLMVNDDP